MNASLQTRSIESAPSSPFDVETIRRDFPILCEQVHGHPLAYLDNGATSQKPRSVIAALDHYYLHDNANVHRGVHTLSERATEAYEAARVTTQRFLNARDRREIIFVRGTTEAINLVAQSYGRPRLQEGDEVVVSAMEHHSNIVPWQLVCKHTGAKLRVIPMNEAGELKMDDYLELLGPRTRIVSVVHVSNSLGTVNPVRRIIDAAHALGVPVLLDGAQAVPHLSVDVQALDVDFYAFSGHKVFGPTGIGILYGKADLLEAMEPYQGGGDMIKRVTFEETEFADLPHRFEAGTPNIAGAIGLGAGIDYLTAIGVETVAPHEDALLAYATEQVAAIPGIRVIGTAADKTAILSFTLAGVHPHDIGTVLDGAGVAIRTGHHCTMPVMTYFGIPATARASLALYNNRADVDALVAGMHEGAGLFTR